MSYDTFDQALNGLNTLVAELRLQNPQPDAAKVAEALEEWVGENFNNPDIHDGMLKKIRIILHPDKVQQGGSILKFNKENIMFLQDIAGGNWGVYQKAIPETVAENKPYLKIISNLQAIRQQLPSVLFANPQKATELLNELEMLRNRLITANEKINQPNLQQLRDVVAQTSDPVQRQFLHQQAVNMDLLLREVSQANMTYHAIDDFLQIEIGNRIANAKNPQEMVDIIAQYPGIIRNSQGAVLDKNKISESILKIKSDPKFAERLANNQVGLEEIRNLNITGTFGIYAKLVNFAKEQHKENLKSLPPQQPQPLYQEVWLNQAWTSLFVNGHLFPPNINQFSLT